MKGKIRNFFPSGNTSYGFYSFYQYIITNESLTKKIFVSGGLAGNKSRLLENAGELFSSKGYDVEYHHCSFNSDYINSIVINDLNLALLDGTLTHVRLS
ncbi:ATPase [Clostridium sp. DJ247]|uniref:ATPase n=1 Tax=Clostridium sp. DJ247 TaxID=2726188 RepID=UPI0016257605|nr:ATPase [Clostridium sp. DJ247]MBC2579726.1 ATPase [Clostridium sp. DJ247]